MIACRVIAHFEKPDAGFLKKAFFYLGIKNIVFLPFKLFPLTYVTFMQIPKHQTQF